jgi:hypothetical protein
MMEVSGDDHKDKRVSKRVTEECWSSSEVNCQWASLLDFLLPRAQPPGQVVDTVSNALQALRQNRFRITRTRLWLYHGRMQHRGSIISIGPSYPKASGSSRLATRLCLSSPNIWSRIRPAHSCRFHQWPREGGGGGASCC